MPFVVGAYNVTHSFGRAFFRRRSIYHRPLCHCLIFGCLITLEIMYLLIVFLPLLGSSVAGFFGRFLGSEGIMTTTRNLVLLSIFLFLLILICFFFFKKERVKLSTYTSYFYNFLDLFSWVLSPHLLTFALWSSLGFSLF